MSDLAPDARQRERRGPGRPKGGRRIADPIQNLDTHPRPFVTVWQLSDYWGKHAYTVTGYIRKGYLVAFKVGGEYRVTLEAARAFERLDGAWYRHNFSK